MNGMSRHARAGANANAALLVEVRPDDLPGRRSAGRRRLPAPVGTDAYQLGRGLTAGGGEDASALCPPYTAPAQTVGDFLVHASGTPSAAVTPTYPRGVAWRDLRDCLPPFVTDALAEALRPSIASCTDSPVTMPS